jgi:hypothetical protein
MLVTSELVIIDVLHFGRMAISRSTRSVIRNRRRTRRKRRKRGKRGFVQIFDLFAFKIKIRRIRSGLGLVSLSLWRLTRLRRIRG